MSGETRTGGQVVVDFLLANGIDRAYCVPGESYLGVLDAVREAGNSFTLHVCRQEGGAAYMAEAYACLTGRPGVCMVTRGPGACNAAIGIHTAEQEGVPMILLVGHTTTGTERRVAFQEIDLAAFYGGMAKRVFVADRAEDIAGIMEEAVALSLSGRPGPVVVGLPEDIQLSPVPASAPKPAEPAHAAPDAETLSKFAELLAAARAPLLLLGGMGWKQMARDQLAAFAESLDLPTAVTFRRQDLIDNDHPCFVGSLGVGPDPNLVGYADTADLLIMLGGQVGEIETMRYQKLLEGKHERRFVHVAPDESMFGKVIDPDPAICTDVNSFCAALGDLRLSDPPGWSAHLTGLREGYEAYHKPVVFPGRENPGAAVAAMSDLVPPDTVVTMGAGNYTHFVLRHHRYRRAHTLLGPINAPMGSSVPAGIAAAQIYPDREVLAYAGDGCFLMNAQELVMAAKQQLRLTVIIFNNGLYGSIRMHQELNFPGQAIATDIDNPDFVEFAGSMDIPAHRIEHVDELTGAYKKLRSKHSGPILIEMLTDPDISTPQATVDQIRKRAP